MGNLWYHPGRRNYVERGITVKITRYRLDGDKRHCPKCTGLLLRDRWDLFCLCCGWRESYYFGMPPRNDTILQDALCPHVVRGWQFEAEPDEAAEIEHTGPLYVIRDGVPVQVEA